MSAIGWMGADSPERFGRYVLVAKTRQGGMSKVALAVDTSEGQIVVVKRPNANAGDIARFRDEIQVSRALGNHQNLIRLIDSGAIDGTDYMALEWIAGQDVGAMVDRAGRFGKRFPLGVAASIVKQVCAALDYAHQRNGFVHRDVKPGNILVGYDGATKLIDYGGALSAFKRSKTEVGRVFGSVGYIAPEIAKGALATGASDLYALGAVFFFVLTGSPPFGEGFDGHGKEVLRHRLAEFQVNDLPEPLVTFLWRTLQTAPRHRYESAAEMAGALELAVSIATPEEVAAFLASIFPVEKKDAGESAAEWRAAFGPAERAPEKTAIVRAVEKPEATVRSTMVIDRRPARHGRRLVTVAAVTLLLVAIAPWLVLRSIERRRAARTSTAVTTSAHVATTREPAAAELTEPSAPELAEPTPDPATSVARPPTAHAPRALARRLQEARALVREGKTMKATDLLDELAGDPRLRPAVEAARAELAAQEGDFNGAIARASVAARLGAGMQALVIRASAEMHVGRFADAERDYDRVLNLDPHNQAARDGKLLAHEKRQEKGP